MPENTNKDKLSNYSINFDGSTRTHIGIGEVKGGPLLPGGQTYTSNVTVQNPKFSGSAFINFDTSLAYPVGNIVGVGQVGGASFWFLRKNANNNIEFVVRTDAGSPYYATITGSTVLNANQWYHAAFSWDGNTITLYLNGSVDGSGSATTFYNSSFTYSGYASIGSYWRGSININELWVGELSQVSIFDYALDSTQINYLYNLNNPMVITGGEPIAYWPLGDNSNPNASAGYPNISVGADSVFEFDSTGTRIDLGLESSLSLGGASKYSTSLWFKKSGNTTNCLWGYNYGDANGSGWYYWLNSGNLRISIGKNGISSGFGAYDISASELPVGKWQHIVVVFNGTLSAGDDRIKVYHNGANAVGTYSNSANFPATLPNGNGASNRNVYLGQLQLGNGSFSYNYDGELSNVQQWGTDLSLANASTLYNNGQPIMTGTQPEAANLKAWYKLNQHDSYWDLGGNGKWTFNNAAIN